MQVRLTRIQHTAMPPFGRRENTEHQRHQLRRRFGQVFYWRGGGEVDFVVTRGREAIPVQVSLSGKQARHERALDSFYEAHPQSAEAIFISRANFYDSIESLAG